MSAPPLHKSFFRPAPSDSLRSISRNFSFVNTFFHFFEKSFFARRFAQVFIISTRSSNSLRIIPRIFSFVNTFFHLFEKSSLLAASLKSLFFRPAPFDSLRSIPRLTPFVNTFFPFFSCFFRCYPRRPNQCVFCPKAFGFYTSLLLILSIASTISPYI